MMTLVTWIHVLWVLILTILQINFALIVLIQIVENVIQMEIALFVQPDSLFNRTASVLLLAQMVSL